MESQHESQGWRAVFNSDLQLNVALYLRDVYGLEPQLVVQPPLVRGGVPRRQATRETCKLAAFEWTHWWPSLLGEREIQSRVGGSWAVGDDSIALLELAEFPTLKELARSTISEASEWFHRERKAARDSIHSNLVGTALRRLVATGSITDPVGGAVHLAVEVLFVNGPWYSVSERAILCSVDVLRHEGQLDAMLEEAGNATARALPSAESRPFVAKVGASMLTEPVTLATAHGRSLAITEVRGFEDGLELAIEEQSPDPEIAPAVLLEVTYPDGRIGRSSEGTGSASPEVVVSEFHREGDVRTWFWISPVPNPRELLIDFTVPKWNVYHAHARLGMT